MRSCQYSYPPSGVWSGSGAWSDFLSMLDSRLAHVHFRGWDAGRAPPMKSLAPAKKWAPSARPSWRVPGGDEIISILATDVASFRGPILGHHAGIGLSVLLPGDLTSGCYPGIGYSGPVRFWQLRGCGDRAIHGGWRSCLSGEGLERRALCALCSLYALRPLCALCAPCAPCALRALAPCAPYAPPDIHYCPAVMALS
jgi:hypothetical protein